MEESRKQRMTLVLILLAVITLTIIGTYAFFVAQINVNGDQKLTIKTSTLALIFEDGNSGIEAELEFGKSVEKTFTIENTGTMDAYAAMKFEDLINTYTLGSLTYTLEYSETEDGEYKSIITDKDIPQSPTSDTKILANGLFIPAKTKYYYRLTITLNYLEYVDQTSDLNAILSTHFTISESQENGANEENIIEKIKMSAHPLNEQPNFANVAATSDEGVYQTEDDYGTSYYFRGAVNNNYVKFAGFYWRIIRINGDGSLRMIYDGTSAHANGESNNDRSSSFNGYNGLYSDAKYLGYMYGGDYGVNSTSKEQAEENETESNAKKVLDEWYLNNIENKNYGKYISDTLFCNDRSTADTPNTWITWDTALGYGSNPTAYGGYKRSSLDKKPNLICSQTNDKFTVNSNGGNSALTYPIGLITVDEVMLAGGVSSNANGSYYLYKGHDYWTMSPGTRNSDGYADLIKVNANGSIESIGWNVQREWGLAPVINIKSEYAQKMIGSGTMGNPYMIKEAEFLVPEAVKTIKINQTPKNVNEGNPNFANAATSDEGVYSMEDDYGTSYYFRGAVDNNYVKFAGFYWRIIRINGDGSLRLIYDGTSAHANGASSTDRSALHNVSYNSTGGDTKYVGYMYGGKTGEASTSIEQAQTNETESDAKKVLDEWYQNNIENKNYGKYVSDTIFCNDRSLAQDNSGRGYGSGTTYYSPRYRLYSLRPNITPSLKCTQKNDRFTVDDKINGNGSLKYPVGLITADEVTLAGVTYDAGSSDNYLVKGHDYWTMSPSGYSVNRLIYYKSNSLR